MTKPLRANQQITTSGTLHIDNEYLAYEVRKADPNAGYVAILHGGGASTSLRRYDELATETAAAGANVVAFDFSGHGQSTGTLAELSLSRRRTQAIGVISALCDQTKPIVLVGFSMSGQTVCDVISAQTVTVRSTFLGCAAAYRPDVSTLPFGNPEFTEMIREEGTWARSTAFQTLADFPGHVTFLIPDADEVVPCGVTQAYLDSCSKPPQVIRLEHAPHQIVGWLHDQPETRHRIVAAMAASANSS
ncbi:alpha/beta hydrolase [Nocardia brasiliensis]